MMSTIEQHDSLKCPITCELFRDPVMGGDGHTYERTAITQWLHRNGISPLTREPMSIDSLRANYVVKKLIEDLLPSSKNRAKANKNESVDKSNRSSSVHSSQKQAIHPEPRSYMFGQSSTQLSAEDDEDHLNMILCTFCDHMWSWNELDAHERVCKNNPRNVPLFNMAPSPAVHRRFRPLPDVPPPLPPRRSLLNVPSARSTSHQQSVEEQGRESIKKPWSLARYFFGAKKSPSTNDNAFKSQATPRRIPIDSPSRTTTNRNIRHNNPTSIVISHRF